MSMQSEIDKVVEDFRQRAPAELVGGWEQGVAKIAGLDLQASAPAVGARAPEFRVPDLGGQERTLAELVSQGPVVLKLIRGSWCPFCTIEFAAWKRAAPKLAKAGAKLVVVTPEKTGTAKQSFEGEPFEVLLDADRTLAKAYGVHFELPDELRALHTAFDFEPVNINQDELPELPSPAIFLIDRTGVVRWRFVEANYTRRADPEEVLKHLNSL